MDIVSGINKYFLPFAGQIDQMIAPLFTKLFSWSDPVTIVVTLTVILAPIALVYTCAIRIGLVKATQMVIKDRNILFVIAHPDDEAM